MAYDNTNFYGDLIVSEYDDKGNFMTPPTPTGYYVYHILGDGFDLMSEMCNQFMNDYSILTASTKSLDNFWGVSYNMPRPLLYEGQKREYLFIDNGTTASHYDHWYINSYGTATVQSDGTKLLNTSVTGNFVMRSIIPSNKTITDANAYSYNPPYIVEFDIVETDATTSSQDAQVQIYSQQTNTALGQPLTSGHYKIEVKGDEQKMWIDDTLIKTTNLSLPNVRITLRVRKGKYLIYKNFKVYKGEEKERPLTDEEYKIYLYLRNCRLMTREDIEINMNKCFAVENENSQYYIFFSTETNYLSVVNHLNYNSKTTEESNLAKNDEDTSLNFITNFASDDDTLLIESGLSEVEEVIEVINVPSPNGYDPAFLELLENYISVKGNLKIKEYSI